MKKIYGLMALAMGVATLFSCSDDDKSAAAAGVQVTSAESTIKAAGGSANVEVDQNIVSAYSTEGWLTVDFDGNKLSATAERNNSRESRYSTVVIKASENDSTIVSVSQLGTVFGYSDPAGNVVMDNAGGKAQRYVQHNAEFHVAKAPEWVTTSVKGDSVYLDIAPNTTGDMRKGQVCMESGNYADTLYVTQASFEEGIAGDYRLYFYNAVFDQSSGQITGFQNVYLPASVYSFGKSCTISIPTAGFSWDCTYDKDNLALNFNSAKQIGVFSKYYPVYMVLFNEDLKYNWSTEPQASYAFDMEEMNGQMIKYGTLKGTVLGSPVMGWMSVLAQAKPLSDKTAMKVLYLWLDPMLIEDTTTEQEAKGLTQLTPLKEARLMKQAKAMIFKKHLSGNFDGEFPTINFKK
uniref:BACON domain-containing protein n=1 Tax=Prevotella sp. TaxID=59823 RepID=UPI0040285625